MQELGKQEPVMQELGKQEPAMQELGKQEPAMQEPSKQEPAMQEPSTQEAQAQESNAQELDSQEAAPQAPQEPAEEGLQAQDSEEGPDPIAILRKASPDQLPATSASQDGHFVRRPPQASEDSFRRRQDRPFGTPYPSSSRAPRDFQRGSSIIPLEKLIEKQAEQEINRQEEKEDGNKDAEQCLESAFRAARASREEKHTVPKMDLEEESKKPRLSEEQREIFSYFVPVQGMEEQLCQVLEDVAQHKEGSLTSSGGNIVIMGGKGSGKTVLATDFIKAIQKAGVQPGGKVGKITGDSLNQKDLSQLLKKVVGGYLIIERAGEMTHETVTRLALLMDRDTNGLLVILEDTRTEIEKVLSLDVNFAKKFTERIKIPVFTSDELVEFAKAYAAEQECEIDDMGVLALYNRISSIQKLDEPTTLTEVKEIMDEAIYCAERGGLKKLFGGKKFSPEGYLYLRERDFN